MRLCLRVFSRAGACRRGAEIDDIPGAVAIWLVEGVPVQALAVRVAGVTLGRHAEVLETDPALWHWLHVHDRIADDRDVLAPLRPLMELLAASPVATAFYTYSSLNRLCFYLQLPLSLGPRRIADCVSGEGACGVATLDPSPAVADGAIGYDFRPAATVIEEMLAAAPVRPFFGSEPHHDLTLLEAYFAR